MSKSKSEEIKRLSNLGLSKRKIAKAMGVHRRTVDRHLENEGSAVLEEEASAVGEPTETSWQDLVDWETVGVEYLSGVPAKILWEEQSEKGSVPVSYSSFWRIIRKKFSTNQPEATMRRVFKPGERVEIDYCDGIDIYDHVSGEVLKTHLFMGCLCYSRFTFAEFTLSQKSADFLSSHRKMFEYFGGVPQLLAPDNLKSAVIKAHRYDPDINKAYLRLAEHYDCAVVPARVRKPKDKAIVERTLQSFQRWFYFKVRNETFTSLWELNKSLREHLNIFNRRIHKTFGVSRLSLFEREKASFKMLPSAPYLVQTHSKAKLHPDCHISFEKNFYSAPHQYRGKYLDIWASETTVEIYFEAEKIAHHSRLRSNTKFATNKHHYPEGHQAYWDENVKSLRTKASRLGPDTSKLVHLMLSPPDPLRHLRRCQGIVRLADKYSRHDLNQACSIALKFQKYSTSFIEKLLKYPKLMETSRNTAIKRGDNPNLRGHTHFLKEDSND